MSGGIPAIKSIFKSEKLVHFIFSKKLYFNFAFDFNPQKQLNIIMIKVFKSKKELSIDAAQLFVDSAKESIEENGKFIVALTGGSSPNEMYALLTQEPYVNQVEWGKVHFFWGDERHVPYESDLNNARVAHEVFLNHVPAIKENIHIMDTALPLEESAKAYEAIIHTYFPDGKPVFDLIFLGMGADAHTASLFPGTDVLQEKDRLVSTSYNEEQKTDRITLTAPLINQADKIVFLVFGEGKAATLQQVLEGEYQPEKLPTQLIRPEHGKLIWYLDEGSASKLNG